ncbi:MAG: divalent metal cation transporter [Nitrososphaerota archaeon]|nr:divalent metal cation transporter [Nitrososphaerota archaeon]
MVPLGPALLIAIDLFDPASILSLTLAGSLFRYALLWTAFYSVVMLIIVQDMAARLGIVTKKTYPENLYDKYGRRAALGMMLPSTFLDVTTLVAEIIALGLAASILTGINYLWLGPVLAIATRGLVWTGKYSWIRAGVLGFIGIMAAAYGVLTYFSHPSLSAIAMNAFIPRLGGATQFYYAAGIVGAQVATTYIALHSGLVNENGWSERKEISKGRRDTITSLIIGGVISALPIIVAAELIPNTNPSSFDQIFQGFSHALAPWAGYIFCVALIASAFAAVTAVDAGSAYAFVGFAGWKDRLNSKRFKLIYTVFIAVSVLMIELNLNPLQYIILSQVFIAFLLPSVVFPLVWLTSNPGVMGEEYVNRRWQSIAGYAIGALGTALVLASLL